MADRIQSTCVMCFMRDARGYDRGFPLCGMCEKDVRRVLEFLAYHAETSEVTVAAPNGVKPMETTPTT